MYYFSLAAAAFECTAIVVCGTSTSIRCTGICSNETKQKIGAKQWTRNKKNKKNKRNNKWLTGWCLVHISRNEKRKKKNWNILSVVELCGHTKKITIIDKSPTPQHQQKQTESIAHILCWMSGLAACRVDIDCEPKENQIHVHLFLLMT